MTKEEKAIYNRLLELEDEGKVDWDISDRGGSYGLRDEEALKLVQEFIPNDLMVVYDNIDYLRDRLPHHFGAYCNYLGGGIRAAIGKSDFDNEIWNNYPKVAKLLDKLANVCVIRYKELEDEYGLNDECYPDGDTNWKAMATSHIRNTGITSYPSL